MNYGNNEILVILQKILKFRNNENTNSNNNDK